MIVVAKFDYSDGNARGHYRWFISNPTHFRTMIGEDENSGCQWLGADSCFTNLRFENPLKITFNSSWYAFDDENEE